MRVQHSTSKLYLMKWPVIVERNGRKQNCPCSKCPGQPGIELGTFSLKRFVLIQYVHHNSALTLIRFLFFFNLYSRSFFLKSLSVEIVTSITSTFPASCQPPGLSGQSVWSLKSQRTLTLLFLPTFGGVFLWDLGTSNPQMFLFTVPANLLHLSVFAVPVHSLELMSCLLLSPCTEGLFLFCHDQNLRAVHQAAFFIHRQFKK